MGIVSYFMDQLLLFYIPILLILAIVIFVYALAHFYTNRWYGDHIPSLSIGTGPKLFEFKDKKSTLWTIHVFPLFFYKFDIYYSSVTRLKITKRRLSFILLASSSLILISFTSTLIAMLLYGNLMLSPVVGKVHDKSAALKAGILKGDKIISINGQRVNEFRQVRELVLEKGNKPLKVLVSRNSQEIATTLVPIKKNNRFLIGIVADRNPKSYKTQKANISEAVKYKLHMPGAGI